MAHSAATGRRQDVLIELFELGVLDQQELDAEIASYPETEPETELGEQTLPESVRLHELVDGGIPGRGDLG